MIKLKNLLFEAFDTTKPFSTTDPASNGTQINPGNDPWFTRKKGSGSWKNMKIALSPENYDKAINVIQTYVDARNKAEGTVVKVDSDINIKKQPDTFKIDYDNAKIKKMLDRVNARRHPEVAVLGRSEDGSYLKIENPRHLALHPEVYVKADEFELDSTGAIATYKGTDRQYIIYKIK